MNLYYLSFADEEHGFLGGLHIWATTLVEACENARRIGEYPGGEALGGALKWEIAKRVPDRFVNRLLTADDIAEVGKIVFPDDPYGAELITVDSNFKEIKKDS